MARKGWKKIKNKRYTTYPIDSPPPLPVSLARIKREK